MKSGVKQYSVLTFEKEVGIILESVVRLLHGNEARVHCLPLLAVPGLRDELGPKLEDQAEDAVNDVHDRSCLLSQQAPGRKRVGKKHMRRNFNKFLKFYTAKCDSDNVS